jgi:hypothetical protein
MTTASEQIDVPRTLERNLHDTGQGLITWASCSIALVLFYAIPFVSGGLGKAISVFSHGTMIAVAFGSVGSLVGFLFGIPRTLQSSSSSADATPGAAGQAADRNGQASAYLQTVNTNLEQISDWLTKILVGVGLTQLQRIPQKLIGLANYFQSGLGGNAPITLVIILNSMVFGFFAGYLLTRLFLAGAFSGADKAAAEATAIIIQKTQFAQGLTEAGAYSQATSTLLATLAKIDSRTPTDVKRNTYEGLVYNYLYANAPDGFQKAIQYGEKYNSEEPSAPSARLWASLAAAYGQQNKWEQDNLKRTEVLDSSRRNALDAVKRAIALEPHMKSYLRTLWDPKDPTKEPSQENDLEVFYGDPAFQEVFS